MRKSKISDAHWAAARRRWESDPSVSYAKIAQELGCSKANVVKRATANSWQKFGPEPVDSAQISEPKVSYLPARSPGQAPEVTALDNEKSTIPQARSGGPVEIVATRDFQADKRAEVRARHEKEMNALRVRMYEVMRSGQRNTVPDFTDARAIKVIGDALKTLHDMERRHFGLDAEDEKPVFKINWVRGKRLL
jgi:hypothetical protein